MSRKYSKDLKDKVINEYRNGYSVQELAEVYEPHETTIRNWVKQQIQATPSIHEEFLDANTKRLRLEIQRLREEKAILMKAHAWFANEPDDPAAK